MTKSMQGASDTMSDMPEHSFTAAPVTLRFDALLFDMDGTIIDSTDAIVKHWYKMGKILNADPEKILASGHGVRSIETIALYDKNLANWDYIRKVEGEIPKEFGQDAVEIPGSRTLLEAIEKVGVPWTIVTSGTHPLVSGWLDVMRMAHPPTMVTAESVSAGKPDPSCYLLGRDKLKLPEAGSSQVLVLEDAPSGVKAGKAAGFTVVALATTHKIELLKNAGADYVVKDMRSVTMASWDPVARKVEIRVADALVN